MRLAMKPPLHLHVLLAAALGAGVATAFSNSNTRRSPVLATFVLHELRPWQTQIDAIVNTKPTEPNTIHWIFDDQTFNGGRGKGTLQKHWMATRDGILCLDGAIIDRSLKKYLLTKMKENGNLSTVSCRLPRASRHPLALYRNLGVIPPEIHTVVMASFWPDPSKLPSKNWNLYEWNDRNELRLVPKTMNMGGKVGLSNTNAYGTYVPHWDRKDYIADTESDFVE